jgi:hypothetical protein
MASRWRGGRVAMAGFFLHEVGRCLGVVEIGHFVVHFAGATAAVAAQRIDGAAAGDGAQPGMEGAGRIVGGEGAVDSEQYLLHHIVHRVGRHAVAPCGGGSNGHAGAQHGFIGGVVARLGGTHQVGEVAIRIGG